MNRQAHNAAFLPSLLCDESGHYELACSKLAELAEYSGNELFRRHPEKYRLIARLIADSIGSRLIAHCCGVSHTTVEAVRRREKYPIELEKEQLLNTVRSVSRICSERMLELAPTMSARDASIAFGIAAEKMQLLSGEATMIVGKEDSVKHASFNQLIDALPQANARVVTDFEPNLESERDLGNNDAASKQSKDNEAKNGEKLSETPRNPTVKGGEGVDNRGEGLESETIHSVGSREQRDIERLSDNNKAEVRKRKAKRGRKAYVHLRHSEFAKD